jgi:hypothetical protein|tara:strand:- start:1051 stop:1347 length:297 start_codon:yes stop_codon:yes gene_type:complete
MPTLKKSYEDTFKEGYKLGVRTTRAKILYAQAGDAKRLGDTAMATFYSDAAKQWTDLSKNCGRQFTPIVAHEPQQPAFDFGDLEHIISGDKPEEEEVA